MRALQRVLEAYPDAVDIRFALACLLDDLGRPRAARRAYEAVIARAPTHAGALTNAAALAFTAGRQTESVTLFRRAAAARPDDATMQANLGNVLAAVDPSASRAAYERALALDPDHVVARYALGHAFATPVVHVTPSLSPAPLRVLVPYAADGGNLITTQIFDRREVETIAIVAESYRDDVELPAHDAIVNAVADADRSAAALDAVERIVAASGRPCVNHPRAIRRSGRVATAERLASIANLVAPRTRSFARGALDADSLGSAGFTFPLLLRAPGFHAGRFFERVALTGDLVPKAAALPGTELFVVDFVDTRDANGRYRKYRMVIVDGELIPLHLAFSRSWKVHYFSADNSTREASRHAEAAFLADPRAAIGARAYTALECVRDALDLDYGGIDFSFDASGNVVVFEANASFALYLPDDDETAAYRLAAAERAIAAARALVRRRALRSREVMREDGALDDREHVEPA